MLLRCVMRIHGMHGFGARRPATDGRGTMAAMDAGTSASGESPDFGAGVIDVVAAAIVENGRLLVVSKHAAPDVFYLPDGKPESGETLEQTQVTAAPRHRTGFRQPGGGPLPRLFWRPAGRRGTPRT
jgi:hypothetical protein